MVCAVDRIHCWGGNGPGREHVGSALGGGLATHVVQGAEAWVRVGCGGRERMGWEGATPATRWVEVKPEEGQWAHGGWDAGCRGASGTGRKVVFVI